MTNPLLCTDRPSPTQPEQVAWIWWRLRRTHMAPESRPRTLVHIPFFLYVHGFENSRLETFGLSGLGFAFGSLLPTIRCRISLPPRRSLWATSHRRCHGILATSIFAFLPWSGLLQGPIRLDGCIWFLCDFCVLTRVCRAVLGIPPGSTRPARARAATTSLLLATYLADLHSLYELLCEQLCPWRLCSRQSLKRHQQLLRTLSVFSVSVFSHAFYTYRYIQIAIRRLLRAKDELVDKGSGKYVTWSEALPFASIPLLLQNTLGDFTVTMFDRGFA